MCRWFMLYFIFLVKLSGVGYFLFVGLFMSMVFLNVVMVLWVFLMFIGFLNLVFIVIECVCMIGMCM